MISTIGEFLNLNHLDQGSRANDVIVIRHRDGSLHSSPFAIRFGRAKIWNSLNKVVQVEVNGVLTSAVMKIGKGGEAYWLQPTYGRTPDAQDLGSATYAASASSVNDLSYAPRSADSGPSSTGSRVTFQMDKGGDHGPHPPAPIDPRGPPCPRTLPSAGDGKSIADPAGAPPLASLSSPTPASPVVTSDTSLGSGGPFLEERDDGTIGVPRGAVCSAGDAEQAKLALRAVAAAEMSRRRLSRLVTEDPFLAASARQEGAAMGEPETLENLEELHEEWTANLHPARSYATELAAAASGTPAGPPLPAAPGVDPGKAHVPAAHEASGEVAVAVRDGAGEPVAAPPPTGVRDSPANRPRGTAEAVDSDSSDERLFGADDDDYFLDPIDVDDFEAGELEVSADAAECALRNCSFTSSLTSGVSLADVPRISAEELGVPVGAAPALVRAPQQTPSMAVQGPSRVVADTAAAVGAVKTTLKPETLLGPAGSVDQRPSPAVVERGVADEVELDDWDALDDVEVPVRGAGATAAPERSARVAGVTHTAADTAAAAGSTTGTTYFARSHTPTEEDLRKLNLVDGCNQVRYLARKGKDEVVAVSCNIFLWDSVDRLVVSDVDGTITKSDLWGHFYAALGKGADWTHPGICSLYSKIVANGYRMIYLTARSVAQIAQTKSYLWSLQQEGVGLPLGPVLTAPQRFFTALTQEVSKQSHVFKIACLSSVKSAFPRDARPFFAGFGNRYNDLISYDAVGIPTHRIFIIDPSSVLHVCQVKQTYRNLAHLVDVTFPRVRARRYGHAPPGARGEAPAGALSSVGTWSPSLASSDGDVSEVEEGGVPAALRGSAAVHAERSVTAMFAMAGSDLRSAVLLEASGGVWSGAGVGSPRPAPGSTGLGSGTSSTSTSVAAPGRAAASPHAVHGSAARGGAPPSGVLTRSPQPSHASSPRSYGGAPTQMGPLTRAHHVDGEDDVMADPEFSSYSYWRMDPRDLLKPPPPPPQQQQQQQSKLTTASTSSTTGPSRAGGALPTATVPAAGPTIAPAPSAAVESKPSLLTRGLGRAGGTATDGTVAGNGGSTASAIPQPTAGPTVDPSSLARAEAASRGAMAGTVTAPVLVTSPVPAMPPPQQQQPAAAPTSSARRGFLSFRFALGKGSAAEGAASSPPAAGGAGAPTQRSPYVHPDYMNYALGMVPTGAATAGVTPGVSPQAEGTGGRSVANAGPVARSNPTPPPPPASK